MEGMASETIGTSEGGPEEEARGSEKGEGAVLARGFGASVGVGDEICRCRWETGF